MTRSMLAIVTEAYGGKGGIAQYNRDLVDALAGSDLFPGGIDIIPRLAADPIPTLPKQVRQFRPSKGRVAYAARVLRHIVDRPPSVVFCGHLYMAPLAQLAARLARARLVVQLHGIEIWRAPSRPQRRALEAADLVTCVSRHTRMAARSNADIKSERAAVLPNTVADDYRPADRHLSRRRFGLNTDEFVLLSVGRLDRRERYKGHDRVLAELARLGSANDRRVRYIIAGDGDDQPRLEAAANAFGVRGQVSFLGHVERSALPDLYRAADLFVLPSSGEGFGIVFLEAMACGTPALGLRLGGAPDALAEGELGSCIEAPDLAGAIEIAMRRPPIDPSDLAERVRARFGHAAFQQRASEAMTLIQ